VVVRQARHGVGVDLDVALVRARRVHGDALGRVVAGDAGVQVEVVVVQRADDVVAAHRAVAELPAAMRAAVVDDVRCAPLLAADEREVALVDADRHRRVRRQFGLA
jgi:hypothetical protein